MKKVAIYDKETGLIRQILAVDNKTEVNEQVLEDFEEIFLPSSEDEKAKISQFDPVDKEYKYKVKNGELIKREESEETTKERYDRSKQKRRDINNTIKRVFPITPAQRTCAHIIEQGECILCELTLEQINEIDTRIQELLRKD